MPGPDRRAQGGRGRSSPSGQGVLRTVHLRTSLVLEQMARSPPGAWSTLRVRSSEPLRKPQSLFFLEHSPHGDHSLISHCAGRHGGGERKRRGEGSLSSPGPQYPRERLPPALCLGLRPRGQDSPERNPRGWQLGRFSLDSAPTHPLPGPSSSWGPGPSAHGACGASPGLLHSVVPLAAAEPSGQSG